MSATGRVTSWRRGRQASRSRDTPIISAEFIASGSFDTTVRLWDLQRRKSIGKLMRHGTSVGDISWSPDVSFIVSCGYQSITLWDSSTREILRKIDDSGGLWSIAFWPDGSKIFGGTDNGILCVWDVKSGDQIGELKGHTSQINSLAVSPDGLKIISGSNDGTVRLWDISPYHTLHPPTMKKLPSVRDLSPPPDTTVDIKTLQPIFIDGWIYTSTGKRYLWVPVQYRRLLDVGTNIRRTSQPVFSKRAKVVLGEQEVDDGFINDWGTMW